MKALIEKYYSWIFAQDDDKEVPYLGKVFLFFFTLALSGLLVFLLVRDIVRNVQAL